MPIADEQIVTLWRSRKDRRSRVVNRMDEIRRAYNCELSLPLPEMDKVEKAGVANLIQQGIDQLGARIASVAPDLDCPSTYPGQTLADKRARMRRLAILGWWDHSEMDVLDARRARHLIAYGEAPVLIRPGNPEKGMPKWNARSPLATYAGQRPNPDDMRPDDCIFAYDVTLGFLRQRYPDQFNVIEKGNNPTPDTFVEVLEYVDADEFVMLVIGREQTRDTGYQGYGNQSAAAGAPYARLMDAPNRGEICPVVVPKRPVLDVAMGKFEGMIGMYQTEAKLMALVLNASKMNVFPKEWLVGRPGELPEVLVESDPVNGRTGVVMGGVLQPQTLNPSTMPIQLVQMLEQNQRSQGGLPSEFGAQSSQNVRTGRRGADIVSGAIDFPIQEAQTVFGRAKEHENAIAVAQSKAYYGNKTISFYSRKMKGGAGGNQEYVPNEIFTTDVNFVDYPHAGSDANQLAVLIGQLVGLQLISEETARKLHPLVADPEREADLVMANALNKALLEAVGTQVGQGTLSAVDVAAIITALEEDRLSLAAAVNMVHQREQARQAAQDQGQPGAAPPGGAQGPGVPGMPGLAPGPQGQPGGAAVPPGGPPAVGGPTPSQQGLAQLLSSLHQGATAP